MILDPKSKLYIHIFVLTSVLVLLYFVSNFVFGLIKSEKDALIKAKTELLQIDQKREKIANSFSEYSSLQKSIEKLNSSLLSKDGELEFIVFMEDVANKNMLNQSISIADNVKDKNGVSFQVSLSGSFEGVLNFIKEIDNAKYYTNIEQVSFSLIDSVGSVGLEGNNEYPLKEGDISASMLIKVYMY